MGIAIVIARRCHSPATLDGTLEPPERQARRQVTVIEDAEMSDDSYVRLIAIGVPACMLFSGSVVLFLREKTSPSLLQVLGAGCLMLVALTHVFEALHLLPWMH